MNRAAAVEIAGELIRGSTGRRIETQSASSVGGGCINEAVRLQTSERCYFVKYNDSEFGPAMLETECQSLESLAARVGDSLIIPDVIGYSPTGVLVLEWIESSRPDSGFTAKLGRGLAELHRNTRYDRFGFHRDNWIGATPQSNHWNDSWIEFWRIERLEFQLGRARENGYLNSQMFDRGQTLCDESAKLIAEPVGGASLLHGDLWSGNYMCGTDGRPVLVDPACYFGHWEAEFGMIQLFGGVDQGFHDAYLESMPESHKSYGFAERVEIYKLYHLLNHLNLFGPSYLDSCTDIICRYS